MKRERNYRDVGKNIIGHYHRDSMIQSIRRIDESIEKIEKLQDEGLSGILADLKRDSECLKKDMEGFHELEISQRARIYSIYG